MSIQPLPPEVIAQIRSSTIISSLNEVVCELVKNSLDATACNVWINVNYGQGSCSVEDNGDGILPSEFHGNGSLGKAYHTSKIGNPAVHGYQGSFIASLSALSLTIITSHHHDYQSTNTLALHQTQVIDRQIPSRAQNPLLDPRSGTKVLVRDLFGNMPVRVKQRAIAAGKQNFNIREWESLRRRLVLLILAWPKTVALTLHNEETRQKLTLRPRDKSLMFNISTICDILVQASLLSANDKSSWVPIHASTTSLTIDGAVSLLPSPTKNVQFISMGISPVSSEDGAFTLHDQINCIFSASRFGEDTEHDIISNARSGYSQREFQTGFRGVDRQESRSGRKSTNLHPQYFIRIMTQNITDVIRTEELLPRNTRKLLNISETIEAMLHAFLTKYHFRPKHNRKTSSIHSASDHSLSDQRGHGVDQRLDTEYTFMTDLRLRSKLNSNDSRSKAPNDTIKRIALESSVGANRHLDSSDRIREGALPHEHSCQLAIAIPLGSQRAQSTLPSSYTQSQSFDTPPSNLKQSESLILAKDGKILRMPFSEVTWSPVPPTSQLPDHLPTTLNGIVPKINPSVRTGSDLQLWVNPMTEVRSLVNIDNGQTIAASDSMRQPRLKGASPGSGNQLSSSRMSDETHGTNRVQSPWLQKIFQLWENPIFAIPEREVPRICFHGASQSLQRLLQESGHNMCQSDIDERFKEASDKLDDRISRSDLRNADVICQLDGKYILVNLIRIQDSMLVIIDQHAADERIRVEDLLHSFFTPSQDSAAFIRTTHLAKPIVFHLDSTEIAMLRDYQGHFAQWGVFYKICSAVTSVDHGFAKSQGNAKVAEEIVITSLPAVVYERCRQEPKLLIELIRQEAWKIRQRGTEAVALPQHIMASKDGWLHALHTCPQGIIDLLNSRACRSAIMFNDILTLTQCKTLVRRLAACKFPFQCAHGRPSLVPLVDLKSSMLMEGSADDETLDAIEFATRFALWKRE